MGKTASRLRKGIAWALCAGWMALIFIMSAMPGDVSGAQSGTVVRMLLAVHQALFGQAELSAQAEKDAAFVYSF